MNEGIRGILDREIKMTMGCTDPGAIAYAASKAASILDGSLRKINIVLSKNIYKNAAYVGIPVIKKYGIEYAALLGAMIKRPELKLSVLGEISAELQNNVDNYINEIPVTVACSDTDETLYISVTCISDVSGVTVVIREDYDQICHIEKDDQIIYHNEPQKVCKENSFDRWDFRSLYSAALEEDMQEGSILKYEEINKRAAMSNLPEDAGEYLQRILSLADVPANDMANMARIYVLNAGRMRMSGERVPIVSLAGSGNLGITSMLAVSAVCDAIRKPRAERERAIYLSVLIAAYIKSQMNRLTVMCGTAVAGAAGAAAATAYLMGGGCKEAEDAVNTVIGSIAGMLCDGAKESCAFKVSFAAECAVMSGIMAVDKAGIRPGSGIITHDIDENIRNLGYINNYGMKEVDNIMLNILHSQKK
jgi:L-cysteine desulfidase